MAKEIKTALLKCVYKEDIRKVEAKYFDSQIAWVHERLSEGERSQIWEAKLRSSTIPGLDDP